MVPVEEHSAQLSQVTNPDLPPASTLGPSPVSSIIRPQLWVHWTITLLCLAAWGGMMYLGDLAERTDFGLRDILGLRSGRVTSFFSTLMLLWAGQLSLLIYWYRRKSRNDFAGRYRMWLWICGMLQFFLVVTATGAHRPFAGHVQRTWPFDLPMYDVLSWLVPVATLSLAMYRLLRIELKRHRSGILLLNIAGAAAVVAGTALVIGPLLPTRVRDLLEIGSATLAHLALATALLMHARYVVHISNEVPRRQPASRRAMAALRTAVGYLPLPKIRRPRLSVASVGRAIVSRMRRPGLSLPKLSSLKALLKRPSLPTRLWPRIGLPKVPSLRLPRPSIPRLPKRTAVAAPAEPPKEPIQRVAATPPQSRPVAAKPAEATSGTSVQTRAVLTSRKQPQSPPAQPDRHRVDVAEPPRGPRRVPQHLADDLADDERGEHNAGDSATRHLSKKQRRKLRKQQRELQRAGD